MKKKIVLIISCIVLIPVIIALCIWFVPLRPENARLTTGESKIYSKNDILSAMNAVIDDFKKLEGCKLFSLAFTSDEKCAAELKTRGGGQEYMVIASKFRSPVFGGGGWNGNTLYYWNWILARTQNGQWLVLDRGYG